MKDNYELKNPRPNPYTKRMKNGYTIIIDRDCDEDGEVSEAKTVGDGQLQPQTLPLPTPP
uniref:Uncharacterized protein n=1 Tax=uncultured bacterium contig00005 TaxID=1181497 RepID=A0A806KL86_9BACT|nr:hypothetical protein [uncultured bacterium contig00005]